MLGLEGWWYKLEDEKKGEIFKHLWAAKGVRNEATRGLLGELSHELGIGTLCCL